MAPASPDTYVTTIMPSSKYPDRIANYAEAKARATLSTLEAAARAALARHQLSEPKNGDGPIEAIRALRVARSSAVKAATASMNAIRSMLVTAPEHCAHTYADTARQLSSKPASRSNPTPPHWQIRPTPRASRYGYWRDGHANYAGKQKNSTAAALLVTVGDNPQRLRSESSFAHLCGVAPIPASSGKTNRHRLHRGGDRRANQALHTAVVVRLRYHESARSYAQRRTSEGKSMPEIIRCQKRYLAREVFTALRRDYRALAT